jgi:hypothetical protein
MTSIVAASIPNPNSARDLPAVVKKAGLTDIKTEAFAVTTPYEILLRGMTGSLYKAAEDGLVPRADVDEWIAEQSSIHISGDFFHLWFFVLSGGIVQSSGQLRPVDEMGTSPASSQNSHSP